MSTVALAAGVSGTGSVTLQAPNTNSNQIITMPDSTGTLLTSGSPQSGGVIQVVNFTTTTQFTTSSGTFSNTGFSASITPKFSTSKILILARVPGGVQTSFGQAGFAIALYRGATPLYTPAVYENYNNVSSGGNQPRQVDSINYLDSPATTSTVSYNLYAASSNSSITAVINETGPTSITLMEIAA